MLTRLRRRVAGRRPDAGVTLIELLVAMTLATLFGSFAMVWFLGASDASTATTSADLGTASARNALQTWAALLRVAGSSSDPGSGTDRIVSLSATSITFNAYTNGGACTDVCTGFTTKTVTLAMTGTGCGSSSPTNCQLVETGTGSSPSASYVVVSSGVSAGSCLFTPYTSSGSALGCTGLSPAQLASVTSVQLAFSVTAAGRTSAFETSATFSQRPSSTS